MGFCIESIEEQRAHERSLFGDYIPGKGEDVGVDLECAGDGRAEGSLVAARVIPVAMIEVHISKQTQLFPSQILAVPEDFDEVVGGVEVGDEGEHEALDAGGVRGQLEVGGRGRPRGVEGVGGHGPGDDAGEERGLLQPGGHHGPGRRRLGPRPQHRPHQVLVARHEVQDLGGAIANSSDHV